MSTPTTIISAILEFGGFTASNFHDIYDKNDRELLQRIEFFRDISMSDIAEYYSIYCNRADDCYAQPPLSPLQIYDSVREADNFINNITADYGDAE